MRLFLLENAEKCSCKTLCFEIHQKIIQFLLALLRNKRKLWIRNYDGIVWTNMRYTQQRIKELMSLLNVKKGRRKRAQRVRDGIEWVDEMNKAKTKRVKCTLYWRVNDKITDLRVIRSKCIRNIHRERTFDMVEARPIDKIHQSFRF